MFEREGEREIDRQRRRERLSEIHITREGGSNIDILYTIQTPRGRRKDRQRRRERHNERGRNTKKNRERENKREEDRKAEL